MTKLSMRVKRIYDKKKFRVEVVLPQKDFIELDNLCYEQKIPKNQFLLEAIHDKMKGYKEKKK